MKRLLLFGFSIALLFACEPKTTEQKLVNIESGKWRGTIRPQEPELPFTFNIQQNGNSLSIELENADERIPLNDVVIENDSIHIPMYIFDATIHAKIVDSKKLTGVWVKNYAAGYVVPFEANYGNEPRFSASTKSNVSFDGKWEVDFITEEKVKKSIGVFRQDGNSVTGTFLTTTGDYRFLEGVVDGNVMKLSTFDGTHAYLFKAEMSETGEIKGEFWSGKTWYQKWTAKRNEEFELSDPYSLTYLKEGYDQLEFTFPNTSDEDISLSDPQYKNKVIVVQLLGSWCPNCMDETRFFTDWYQKNRDRGVEIIGLAFERKAEVDYARKRVNKMKEKLGVNYEVLIAGTTSQESKDAALPMLNKIMSFPTSIILDRQHKVRKIHTGFSGPGTGEYYENYVEEFNLLMDKLLSE